MLVPKGKSSYDLPTNGEHFSQVNIHWFSDSFTEPLTGLSTVKAGGPDSSRAYTLNTAAAEDIITATVTFVRMDKEALTDWTLWHNG